ncbi:MAG TPA: isocitrate lyase/phosphoenolpyruvate mutase family protein [Stellaceae bacterium]|jgi:methylisocitrate lyase|nr:isocitrate lyase/phosphoenolpyruvate mutase family protein [Stellaceae bacterium]
MTPGQRLRELVAQPEIVVLPGVHDALSAKLAQAHGFEAILAGGNAANGILLGQSDLGQLSMRDLVDHYARIADAVDIPLLVDADTGFGSVHSIREMVRKFEHAGVAGFFMEDQTTPKRCGYLDGKAVISVKEMQGKLMAALDARRDSSLMIIARTDAFSIEGKNAAIERAQAYLETGVDMTFVQGADTVEDLSEVCKKIDCPQLANVSQAAATSGMSAKTIEKAGAAAVMFSIMAMLAAAQGVDKLLGCLKRDGDTAALGHELMPIARYNEIVGLRDAEAREKRFGIQPG